jgi:hypothetical protein
MRQRFARLTAAAVLMLSTVACGSGDGPDFIWLRSMQAIPDAPQLRITFDGYVFRRNLSFGATTDEGAETLLRSSDVSARYHLDYFGPNAQIGGGLLSDDVPIQQDVTTTVVFAGWFDEPEAIVVLTPRLARPLAALQFQFVHATPDIGPLDVYVTEPDTELTATAPFATLQPRGHSDSLEVPFGNLRIRLTHAGTLDVVMDTGTRVFGALETATGPGAQWLFAVAPSVSPGPSPVFLISSSGRNNVQIRDQGHTPVLRATHGLQEAPAADVVAVTEIETEDEDETETEETLLFSNLAYGARSPRVPTPAGTIRLEFRDAAGEGGDEEEEPIAARQVFVQDGNEYGAFLVDGATVPAILFIQVNTRSVATEAKLMFGNLAPGSQFITVYVTEGPDDARTPERVLVRDMSFGNITNHLAYPPGNYFLTMTARATQEANAEETVVIGPLPFDLAGGDVLTHMLFPPGTEGEPPVLEVFDDRLP